MPQHIEAPDGSVVEFPDGMSDDQISAVMRKAYAGGAAAPAKTAPKRSLVQDVTGAMANVNRGLGIGDEMAAGARTVGNIFSGKTPVQDIVPDFKRSMATQRGQEDAFAAEHPHIAAGMRGTGNALTMAVPAGPGAAAFATGGRAVNAARGATVAGLSGAGYAAVDRGSVKDRVGAASRASYDPATLALGAGAGAVAARARPRPTRERAPTLPQLETQRDAAYAAVDASGHRFAPEATNTLMQDTARALDEAGYHAGLHPKTAQMMERIGQSQRGAGGYSPTLTELDQLRQQIGRDVAASPDPGERRMGQIMRDQIDGFIAQSGGSAKQGAGTFKARPIAEGYDGHSFEYQAPNGEAVSGFITPPKKPGGPLEIDINSPGQLNASRKGANRVGPASIRDFAAQIKAAYPEAGSIVGLRTTGARPNEAVASIDLSRVRSLPTTPSEAASAILRARDLNTRVSKLRSLDNLDEAAADRAAATGSGGNRENATRQNVIRFQNRTRNLTGDEQEAASRVIHGTRAGNLFRQAGKLSPQGNGLMLATHLAAAVPTHGASAAVAVGGAVAKLASEAITARNVRALRDLIAQGGEAAQEVSRQLARPEASDLRRQLANDLAVAAGVQGASGASASRPNIFAQSGNP